MLIAEDLLLLLTDDQTGKLAASPGEVDVALGGALLVELVLMQRVDLAGSSEQVQKGHLIVRDATATTDPLLDEALATVRQNHGRKPQNVVTALGKRYASACMTAWPAVASSARRAGRSWASSPATAGRLWTAPMRNPSARTC
jgi:hypothetical protein